MREPVCAEISRSVDFTQSDRGAVKPHTSQETDKFESAVAAWISTSIPQRLHSKAKGINLGSGGSAVQD